MTRKPEIVPETHTLPEVMTPDEVAQALRVSRKTVGRLPIKSSLVGRRRRYLRKHVLDYLERIAS